MDRAAHRITVDIPVATYRNLKEQAARQGCCVRDLALRGVEQVLLVPEKPRRKTVRFPLIASKGPKVSVTNERIYELVEFP